MIREIVEELDTIPFHNERYRTRFADGQLPNNAFFLSFVRYDSEKEKMKVDLMNRFKGDVKLYLQSLQNSEK